MWSKKFWLDLGERALSTFLQAALAVLSVGVLISALETQDWGTAWDVTYAALAAGGVAAVLSAAKSLVAAFTGEKGTAQLVVSTYEEN